MIKIIKYNTYYQALFIDGNLFAFSLPELMEQLKTIHNIEIHLFNFNLN